MSVYKGRLIGFQGSWMSGLANLVIEDLDTGKYLTVPCENAQTVRCLEGCFGDVISEGHTVNQSAIFGKEIYWSYDETGMILGGFSSVDEAPEVVIEEYLKRKGENV